MSKYIFKRAMFGLLIALIVSVITFSLLHIAGDPAQAMAGEGATQEDVDAIRVQYGFDRPAVEQYWDWLSSVARGDLGRSHYLRLPVSDVIVERIPTTVWLGLCGLAFALALAIPLGIIAAIFPNSLVDRVALGVAISGQAVPAFFFGLLLILVFGVQLRWLPISGDGDWENFVLPSIALGYVSAPAIMRLTRSGMLDVLSADYIRTAHAKGVPAPIVVLKHGLRNAMLPVVSVAAVQLGWMLGGSIVIETVFSMNGLGRLAYNSVERADIYVLQAVVLVITIAYVALTTFADILNAYLDPRVRDTL